MRSSPTSATPIMARMAHRTVQKASRLFSYLTPSNRERHERCKRKQNMISQHLQSAFGIVFPLHLSPTGVILTLVVDTAVGKSIRVQYTPEFRYENPYRAVLHGIPPDCEIHPPSKYPGGEDRLDNIIRRIQNDEVFVRIFSPEEFEKRLVNAEEWEIYKRMPTPRPTRKYVKYKTDRKTRSDTSSPHLRRRRRLWGRVKCKSAEFVSEEQLDVKGPKRSPRLKRLARNKEARYRD